MKLREIFDLFKSTYHEWNEDKAPRLGAALAYYSVFSIAPLLVSLVISAALQAVTRSLAGSSFAANAQFWQGVNLVSTLVIVTLLFAMIFKVLPDVKLAWKDVWIGAALTAVLFTLGKYLIGL